MTFPKLGVIGGGQMARALVGGLLDKNVVPAGDVCIIDPDAKSRDWWKEHRPHVHVAEQSSCGELTAAKLILLAVKPHVIPIVLDGDTERWTNKLVLSIAAGVSLSRLTGAIGHQRVVRVMPNTPSLVGEGASGYCGASAVTPADYETIEQMLGSVGTVARVTEPQIDAVTAVSGSGPAYVFVMIEALADGGVAAGLPRAIAMKLATQTVLGAAMMVRQTGDHPAVLKDNVCSPGGTTIAAIQVLEQNGFRGAVIDAVIAAADRSRQLGNP